MVFKEDDLRKLDADYFSIIVADDRDVTVKSNNTGHYWYLHCTEYPTEESCIIFHKHKYEHPYHRHGRASTLRQAVKSIQGHDRWQLGGRK